MTRLYDLRDAGQAVGIQPEDLLRLGAAGHLTLCVLVPANTRAFTIAPRSTAIRDAQVELDKHLHRVAPSPSDVPVLQNGTIGALCLTQAQCRELFAFGTSRTWEFRRAYVISTTSHFGYSDPLELTPIRVPLFNPDGSSAPQDHWRFAVYPTDKSFVFEEHAGFPAPQELLVGPADVRVLGRELGKLPKLVDASLPEENAGVSPAAPSAQSTTQAPPTRPSPPPAGSTTNQASCGSPDTGEMPRRKRKRTKAEVLASGISDPVFIDIEEVIRKTGLGKSTIYDYLNPKHKLYDPTFPTQITIGNRAVGWLPAEIEAWAQARIANSRSKPAKKRGR